MVKRMITLSTTLTTLTIALASLPTFVTRNDGDVVESDGLAETAGGGGDIMLDTRGSSQ